MFPLRQLIFVFTFHTFLFADSNSEHSMRKSVHILHLLSLHLKIHLGKLGFREMEELESNLSKSLG